MGRGAERAGGAGAAFLEPKSPPPEDEPPRRERCGGDGGEERVRLGDCCVLQERRFDHRSSAVCNR